MLPALIDLPLVVGKALDQIVLAAGPLLNPPLGPAIQPKIPAILARVLAAATIDLPLVVGKL